MTSSRPTSAEEFGADAFEGAVMTGIIIPVMQYVLLAALNALPTGTLNEVTPLLFVSTVAAMGLLPIASTMGSMIAAYAVGGPIAVVLYVVMSIAASAVFGAPVMGIIVLLVAIGAMVVWLLIQSSGQHLSRRGRLGND